MQRRVAWLALAFFLIVSAAILAGVADGALLCDDAFYYFQIARNASLGRGFSFDGLAPTNGFHPLWGWICAALWWSGGARAGPPVHAALILLTAATAATALVVARIGRAVAGERVGATMAALWLLSPYALLIPLRGCESALSALTLALATWSLVTLDRAPTVGRAALVGLAVGAAGLARTENVLFGAAALVFVAWRTRSWRALAAYVAIAGAVVSPWLVWSWLRLGTVVQVSGSVKRTLDLYGRLPPVRDPVGAVANVIHALVGTAGWVVGEEFRRKPIGAVLMALTAAVVAVAAWRGRARPSPRPLVPLYAHALGQLAFYCWFLRAYY
ncbi:MAG: glycosyltransferase family 39 protein, partial [Polyangia bacterium]